MITLEKNIGNYGEWRYEIRKQYFYYDKEGNKVFSTYLLAYSHNYDKAKEIYKKHLSAVDFSTNRRPYNDNKRKEITAG